MGRYSQTLEDFSDHLKLIGVGSKKVERKQTAVERITEYRKANNMPYGRNPYYDEDTDCPECGSEKSVELWDWGFQYCNKCPHTVLVSDV